MTYALIMAGGAGTRFWPKSRLSNPKQFINLFGDDTMIQKTVKRLRNFMPQEHIMVITNEDYVSIVREQVPDLNPSYIIGEPVPRNTAPCVAAAAALLYQKDPDGMMVVLPADHLIGNNEEFYSVLETASNIANKENSLVTIGIEPNRPETGYGYIRKQSYAEIFESGHPVFEVRNFTEKPDSKTALQFLESGEYLWNSGIFVWKISTITEAFKQYLPEVYTCMETLMESDKKPNDIEDFYQACPSVSIDYGIMEKADKVHVVPGNFDWNDVGSWKAVHELSKKDENGNASGETQTVFVNAKSNLVYSESGKLIAVAGVENIAVVETEDSILVVDLDSSQDVKAVYETLKANKKTRKFI